MNQFTRPRIVFVDQAGIHVLFRPDPSPHCKRPCVKGEADPCPLCCYEAIEELGRTLAEGQLKQALGVQEGGNHELN